jgi:plasmid maintenance system antidote protein VapI
MDVNESPKAPTLTEALRNHVHTRSINSLSKITGVDRAAISRFSNGRRGLTLDTAGKLAQALGLTLTPKP